MIWRMLVVLLVLVAIAAFGLFGIAVLASTARAQRKAEANAEEELDAVFDGSPDVTYALNMRTLKYKTVIAGAEARGYKLTHQASNQYGPSALMFQKA